MACNYTIVETVRNITCIKFQKWRRGKKLALLFQNLLSFVHHFRRFVLGCLAWLWYFQMIVVFPTEMYVMWRKNNLHFRWWNSSAQCGTFFFRRIQQSNNFWGPYNTGKDFIKEVSRWKVDLFFSSSQCVKINENLNFYL